MDSNMTNTSLLGMESPDMGMAKKSPVPDLYVTALSMALEQRRRELGLSQDELAEKAGLHRTYVSLIERKSCNFSIKIFMRLAFALDVDPAELMRIAEATVKARKEEAAAANQAAMVQPAARAV